MYQITELAEPEKKKKSRKVSGIARNIFYQSDPLFENYSSVQYPAEKLQNLSYEIFFLGKTHFHMNGLARRLVLTQS